MRCIKCLNTLKKSRLIFGLCSVLLSVCLVLSGLLSQSVSAGSYTYKTGWNLRYIDGTTWLGGTTPNGEAKSLPAGATFDVISSVYSPSRFPQFVAGKYYLFTASAVFHFGYHQDFPDPMPTFNCPQVRLSGFSNISCDIAVGSDVSGGDHYVFYTWTSVAHCDISTNTLEVVLFSTFLKNKSVSPADLYVSALTIGDSSQEPTTSAIQSLNSDLAARIQLLIDTTSNFASEFHLFYIDFQSRMTAILNAIGNSGITQQGVQNAVNNAIDSQQQEVQQQTNQAQSSADQQGQQAQAQGTTLLAGFQSFVNALTGATPSNCVINADLGNMDLGNIDLCQLSPPPVFQAITSIMVIGFTVPLSIALAKKMISLFRSFQT